jgi:hypothetical protein
VGASTTSAPAIPNDLRASSCAIPRHTGPSRRQPQPAAWPTAHFARKSVTASRSHFLSPPGMLPLYSGVTTRIASASATAPRSVLADAGRSAALSMS